MQSRCCWPPERPSAFFFSRSLTSSQSAACAQRLLDAIVEAFLPPEHAGPEGDVVVDRLRERVRLLEDHPDLLPHLDGVDVLSRRGPRRGTAPCRAPRAGDQVVHVVEDADERALAAAGRADDRRHLVAVDRQRDLAHRQVAVVGHADALHVEHEVFVLVGQRVRVRSCAIFTGGCVRSCSSPSPLVAVPEPDGDSVQAQQDAEQDDDRSRGERRNSSCGRRTHW